MMTEIGIYRTDVDSCDDDDSYDADDEYDKTDCKDLIDRCGTNKSGFVV